MAILVTLGLFVFLMAVITGYGYVHFARPGGVFAQLGQSSTVATSTSPPGPRFYGVVQILEWAGEQVPVSATDASYRRRLLMMAGFRDNAALPVFYGTKVVAAVAAVFLAVSSRVFWAPSGAYAVLVPVLAGVGAYLLPNLMLDLLISRRQEMLHLSLPDALDLMVVCVEAGLGLDQALRIVSQELRITHPVLCDELSLVSLEMRAGTARAIALKNLAARTGDSEMRKLVAVLVQTDRFGTSMADALRAHSEFIRMRRRQVAEERANKLGVKLIFPIFFFIMPALITIAAGPGLLQLFKNLYPLLREAHL
jgi:tight adherence protein C